ncbi:hypothetical protein ACF081_20115 [Streptomyces longwoodensis]|uniref:hypothetical protein n=1 Tax=Streptomyces longwoodensis TaxID=68231 RepID=UPI0036F874BA
MTGAVLLACGTVGAFDTPHEAHEGGTAVSAASATPSAGPGPGSGTAAGTAVEHGSGGGGDPGSGSHPGGGHQGAGGRHDQDPPDGRGTGQAHGDHPGSGPGSGHASPQGSPSASATGADGGRRSGSASASPREPERAGSRAGEGRLRPGRTEDVHASGDPAGDTDAGAADDPDQVADLGEDLAGDGTGQVSDPSPAVTPSSASGSAAEQPAERVLRIVPLGSGLILIGLGLGIAFLALRLRRTWEP